MQKNVLESKSKILALKALEHIKSKRGVMTNMEAAVTVVCNFLIDFATDNYSRDAKLVELEELKKKLDTNPFPDDKPYMATLDGINKAIELVKAGEEPINIVNTLQQMQGFRV